MSTISLSDLYAAPSSNGNRGANASGTNPASDPTPLPSPTGNAAASSAPAMSWIAIVGTLVALRFLWEYAE